MSNRNAHTAGAFDIRNIIGLLLGIYGLIMLGMGIFGDPETEKTGGINANLWAGVILLVVGVGFMAWAKLKPVVVPEHFERDVEPGAPH
ncbi:hypothetical protein K8W59_01465 [Nocardioides rotundus]|uniref:hypothetical protein n=1 Tax=Nocardioides rotundus TaxID=1774216 RepID=UPI001CC005E8|nr:hypothetical protein [Nocardioides rotundus]UAL30244.1 hypothetical protein K8W59_01465 [Nocardioides rotundus]